MTEATLLADTPELVLPPGPKARKRGAISALRYYLNFAIDPFSFVGGRFERYGDIYCAPNPHGHLFVIKRPSHIHEVLALKASSYRKTHTAFEQMSLVLGDGLVTSDGEIWKRHRRMLQPAFKRARIAEYAEVMVHESERFTERWQAGQTIEVAEEMHELTLRVVSRTLFTHDVSKDADAVREAMSTFQESMARPDLLPAWLPSPSRRRMKRAVDALDRIVYGLIRDRRNGEQRHPDLLQRLVDAVDEEGDGARLSEREVRDELITLFLAGHETTAVALAWTFYLLSQNPKAQQKLEEELDRVLGKGAARRAPTYDDLLELPYTDQVIKETMRLFPPAYVIARRAHEDTEIGGYAVPKGSEIAIWLYMTHRDERWFKQPEHFLPERFSKEMEPSIPKMAYLPFGGGPRACIGNHFAMVEARLMLATLAHRYRFELLPGAKVKPKPRITLRPAAGIRMRLIAR